jgi:formylglycine-generating enzyme required for sulfatase activity
MGSTAEELRVALQVTGTIQHWRECFESEAPQHRVILTKPIFLGVFEATQGQYETLMGSNPSHFTATGKGKDSVAEMNTANFPVEMMNWTDAAEFCATLNRQENHTGKVADYRLPTEAEWEFACRAGTTTLFSTGDTYVQLEQTAWFARNEGRRSHAVGELKPNACGLYDMHGNVWEWVQDAWVPTYYTEFRQHPAVDPVVLPSTGSLIMGRGGHWWNLAANCRSAARYAQLPSFRSEHSGFRVALSVDSVRQQRNGMQLNGPSRIVDLLKEVDVDRDAVKGKWTLTADGLASDGTVPFCRLKLPHAPPAEYDFRIEFTAQGGNDILQIFPVGAKSCTWLMGAWGGKLDGFDTIMDHPLTRDGTNIIGGPSTIRRGQRHTAVIQVRRDSIAAQLDGK